MPPSLSREGRNSSNAPRRGSAPRRLSACFRNLNAAAGGAGERVAREPLTGRVASRLVPHVRSGPVGERATPTPGAGAPDRVADRTPLCYLAELPQTLSRDDDADGRAFSRLALDFAESSEESDALAHSEQTEVPRPHASFAPLFRLETVPVITYVNFQRLLIFEKCQANFVSGRMFLHVIQRFDRHAIERRLRLP